MGKKKTKEGGERRMKEKMEEGEGRMEEGEGIGRRRRK
jgi:hypothetical protein